MGIQSETLGVLMCMQNALLCHSCLRRLSSENSLNASCDLSGQESGLAYIQVVGCASMIPAM